MTDDQGHNDTAVPPKTTSAKEAAPPTIGDNNKRNILNIYDIRDSEKNTPEKIQNILEYMLRSMKKIIYDCQRSSNCEQQRYKHIQMNVHQVLG